MTTYEHAVETLLPCFERKLHRELEELSKMLDQSAPYTCQGATKGPAASAETWGDALQLLAAHANVLARRESQALALTLCAWKVEPDVAWVEELIAHWRWSYGGRLEPEDMFLPAVLSDVMTAAGLRDTAPPKDVSLDEIIAINRERCPERVLGYYSTPVTDVRSKKTSHQGAVAPDCHVLSARLLLTTEGKPQRAFIIDSHQLMWLYAITIPEDQRTGLRHLHQSAQVFAFLGSVSKGDAQRRLLEVIAPEALKRQEAPEALLHDETARGLLAESIRRHVAKFLSLKLRPPDESVAQAIATLLEGSSTAIENIDADTLASQMLADLYESVRLRVTDIATALDDGFTAYVATLGNAGKKLAALLRQDAVQRTQTDPWQLWRYEASGEKYLVLLAQVLWVEEVRPEIARRDKNHEALAMPVHYEVARIFSRAGQQPNDDALQLVFDDGTTIAFDSPLLDSDGLALVLKGIGLLGNVDSHRLLHLEVKSGYMRWIKGVPNPHVLDFERGWGELAEQLGLSDKAAPQRLRAIAWAQRTCAFPLPGQATGNLIVLTEWKGAGRRAGRVRIELSSFLMPGYVRELGGTFKGRQLAQMQKLVPLVPLPPFVGNERSHGAQATLSLLVTRELRVNARELYSDGGVAIDLLRWAKLAEEARIPRSHVSQQLKPILDRWTNDGDDGPAFLKPTGRERFTLGDHHKAARRFLEEAGKSEADGSAGGKRSIQMKRAKRARQGA